MSETIEERYQKVKGILTGLWNQEDTTCGEAYEAEKFLDDLMAERRELQKRIEQLEQQCDTLQENLNF